MKLELKHLKGYLDTGLKGQAIFLGEKNIYTISTDNVRSCFSPNNRIKPILRPLSDLNSEIEFNNRKFNPIDELAEIEGVVVLQYSFEFFETSMKYLPHWIVQQLLEWHFDIYGLIEKGLAIDINKL